MIGISTSTWGIDGSQFLWGYCAASTAAAITIANSWRRALGPLQHDDPPPDLATYDLALLTGGPELAITSAAAELYRDGLLTVDPGSGALAVAGELDPTADPLEHEVFETIRSRPGITAAAMCEQVAESEAVQTMIAELTQDGLLIGASRRSALLRLVWVVGGLLVGLGTLRILAGLDNGAPVGYLALIVIVLAGAITCLIRRAPRVTSRGRAELERWRTGYDSLRRQAIPGQVGLGAALFGGAALWLAAPEFASAFGVERETASAGSGGGGGGGGGGCGGGGCGGGGCGG